MQKLSQSHKYQNLEPFGMEEYTSSSIISDEEVALKTLIDSGFVE